MNESPAAILVGIDQDGNKKELSWQGDPLYPFINVVEIIFLRFPTQDELYTLFPVTSAETKWCFAGWKGWNVGDIGVLMGAYE